MCEKSPTKENRLNETSRVMMYGAIVIISSEFIYFFINA